MLEISADIEPYMMLISVFVAMATIFALVYLLKHQVKYQPVYKQYSLSERSSKVSSQRLKNERDEIRTWISLIKYRCETSDDVPPSFLLEAIKFTNFQGGTIWEKNFLHSSRYGFLPYFQSFC
ncbi:hypothetical protein [Metabacillus sp. RGM 3146]|uniref:hypothetical protein n=1 Tax=Metabacillus sp. RGM 3146 TaxID=3401092 RepID=UPI003B9C2B89